MSGKMPWFRLYSRIVDDDKLRLLAFEDRWHFVALCCLKSDGLLDEPDSDIRTRRIAVKLGVQVRELDEIARRLREVELVDERFSPVKWDDLQFRSDTSSERVKRYRQRRKEQGLVAQWQPSKQLREAVYDRDGRACVYCGDGEDLTLDHKIPEMHGGDNSFGNLQTACRRCNAQKRDLTHEEYVERLNGNGHVTLPKRPNKKITDTEQNIEPKGSCASGDAPAFTVSDFTESWNEVADSCGLSKLRKLTEARKRAFRVRQREYPDIEDWKRAFRTLRDNPWMHGDNKTGWRADPDFFLQAKSFTKLVEGAYGKVD